MRRLRVVVFAALVALPSVVLGEPGKWNPEGADAKAVMGSHQRSEIEPSLRALTRADRSRFQALLDGAASNRERAWLVKALASGNEIGAIEWLAARIHGRSAKWLAENLTLTDMRQQFRNTCTVTVVMALVAEYDPVFALRVRTKNADPHAALDSDPFGVNRELARFQERLLLGRPRFRDGTTTTIPYAALARDDFEGLGGGRAVSDWLDSKTVARRAHLRYVAGLSDWFDSDRKELDAFLGSERFVALLESGMAIPIEIGNRRPSHEVLLRGTRLRGGVRQIGIYEPWEGRVVWRTQEQFRSGKLHVLGMNKVKVVYLPEAVPLASSPAAETRARAELLGAGAAGPERSPLLGERVRAESSGIVEKLAER